MNMQERSEKRSRKLHGEIAKKLRRNPDLWEIPKNNIIRWKKRRKSLTPALVEWERILESLAKKQILSILEGASEDSIRLRSSSPFTGILGDDERKAIFELHRADKR